MKIKISTIVWTLLFSLFLGVIGISIGAGAAFPPLNYIASPFVCPNGSTLGYTYQNFYYKGDHVPTMYSDYACISKSTGAKTTEFVLSEEYTKIDIYAGLIYGVLLCLVILLLIMINGLLNRTYAN